MNVFLDKNECNIEPFYLNGKMGSACIAAKNGQGAFLITQKWVGHVFSCRKMHQKKHHEAG